MADAAHADRPPFDHAGGFRRINGQNLPDSGTPAWIIVAAIAFFGLPLGTFSTATQAAVYIRRRRDHQTFGGKVLVVDAMTDLSSDAHRHSIEAIFPGLGETATTDDVLTLLAERPALTARDRASSRPASIPAQQ